jgi:phosphonate transport system substrate-binding protein
MKLMKLLSAAMVGGLLATGAQAADRPADPDTLKVALLPDENARAVIQQNKPFERYLENTLDKEVELVVTTDYSSMIEAMRFGRLDLAYFGPLSYVMAKSKTDNVEAFAALLEKGSAVYHSIMIAHKGSGVETPSDAAGKNVAFGDTASTSSHLIPKKMLLDAGLEHGADYEQHFTGAHDAVAAAVQNGHAQVGGLSKPIFESLVDRGTVSKDKVRVLKVSEPYPQYPWTLRNTLTPELQEKIKTAFYDLKDPEVLKPLEADGFAPVSDKDYDIVRELAREVMGQDYSS